MRHMHLLLEIDWAKVFGLKSPLDVNQGPVVQSVVNKLVKGHFVNCFNGFNIHYFDIFAEKM